MKCHEQWPYARSNFLNWSMWSLLHIQYLQNSIEPNILTILISSYTSNLHFSICYHCTQYFLLRWLRCSIKLTQINFLVKKNTKYMIKSKTFIMCKWLHCKTTLIDVSMAFSVFYLSIKSTIRISHGLNIWNEISIFEYQ